MAARQSYVSMSLTTTGINKLPMSKPQAIIPVAIPAFLRNQLLIVEQPDNNTELINNINKKDRFTIFTLTICRNS